MPNIVETLLRFKIAQLEGKLVIYETLIQEIDQLDSIEKATVDIKRKLEDVANAWQAHMKANGV